MDTAEPDEALFFDAVSGAYAICRAFKEAVLKFCLISLGLMIGMTIGKKHRKPVFLGALGVFAVTCVPLMLKFYKVFTGKE